MNDRQPASDTEDVAQATSGDETDGNSDIESALQQMAGDDPQALKILATLIQDQTSPPDYDGEIGDVEPVEDPDVDITLHPSREIPVAGELWSIAGEIYNRSSKPIWIVDRTTVLTLAPEMYGQSSLTGSSGAFFPTSPSRPHDEAMRIDPGAKYAVVWKLDPMSSREQQGALQPVRKRIANSIRNYAFFSPGTFHVACTVHVWATKPTFNDKGRISNMGASFAKTVSQDIPMESSPWVLIAGAACGGILCFLLQILMRYSGGGISAGAIVREVLVGLTCAMILSGVVTVLLSRLATTDFLLVVKVKDIWGSIATGFVVQWFGYTMIEQLLRGIPTATGGG